MDPAPGDPLAVVHPAIELVGRWLADAAAHESRRSQRTMRRLEGVVVDPDGLAFVMAFIDRVARPDDDRVAATQLRAVVEGSTLPGFLSPIDRLLLRAGARLGPLLPQLVMPLARLRMRAIVGHLVAPADAVRLADHVGRQRADGWASNVNLLGEAVLGDEEAARRHAALIDLLAQPDVDYVSVKLSSVVAQLNPWAWDDSIDRVSARLAELVDHAHRADPPTFVNVDMEEYHDLELTLDAFERVLGAPERLDIEAGIVLQAYLPDALPALERVSAWAAERVGAGGAPIKVRLVKGANLAMEQVDAAMHGWEQAPYATKADTDANYVRCVDWVLRPDRLRGLRIGLASHNLFHVAWTMLIAEARGVGHHVQFEMLQGMAEAQAGAVAASIPGDGRPLLYTPAVDPTDFDVAVGYLFRRLDENAAPDNFLRALFDLEPGSATLRAETERFRASVRDRDRPPVGARRDQDRARVPTPAFLPGERFRNDAETDPTLPANRAWLDQIRALRPAAAVPPLGDPAAIDAVATAARNAQLEWTLRPPEERRAILHRVADALDARRGELLRTMADEAGKTAAEADIEICEAIDFGRYYAEQIAALDRPGPRFTPFELITVVPPWNFPVAIPAGGVLAALAAGAGVLFKPAPQTRRCASIVHDAVLAGGVPAELCAFVPTGDDDAGRRAVETADAVILTGSTETADLFRDWDPAIRLFAETSGKNALVVTPHADLDLAAADLVRSAFGHAGQKCSAASLGILVGPAYDSTRFRRQLVDAVRSLRVGPAAAPATMMGPLIGEPNERLARALGPPDPGESWLIEPELLEASTDLWSPGVRLGVRPGSWFHRTECFGPVLGLVRADDLDHAIRIQNDTAFGLTGGLHSLDPAEVERWTEGVAVGNAYVNRPITGAVVQRQPFGGWKRSSVGPGAKAGGPNYVAQLGTWSPTEPNQADDYEEVWRDHFAVEHDPTALFCESNVFRYRPLDRVVVRHGPRTAPRDLELVRRAAAVAGVEPIDSDGAVESDGALAARLADLDVARVRVVGEPIGPILRQAAIASGVHLADTPVVPDGRIELLHFVREQAVSTTLHRFGNLPPARRADAAPA